MSLNPFTLPSREHRGLEEIPYARRTSASYEKFTAWCPHCGFENHFSRASDLNFEPVDFRAVACAGETCGQPFHINGDIAAPEFDILFWDCYRLIEDKEYGKAIGTLAQAYEVFFRTYLEAELIWKPYVREAKHDLDRANRLQLQLRNVTIPSLRGFKRKRRAVLWHMSTFSEVHRSLDETEPIIQNLKALTEKSEPDEEDLRFQDRELAGAAIRLRQTQFDALRNRVVHDGYRPRQEKAEESVAEARRILLPLGWLLHIQDDVNLYSSGTLGWGVSRARLA